MTPAEHITDEQIAMMLEAIPKRADGSARSSAWMARVPAPYLLSLLTELQHRRAEEAVCDEQAVAKAAEELWGSMGAVDAQHFAQRVIASYLAASPSSPASGVKAPDIDMALHWIDRYAAGIDEEPQMSRILDALGVSALGEQP